MKRRTDQKSQVTTPDASRVVPWIFDQLPWMHPGYFGFMNYDPGYIQGTTLDASRVNWSKIPGNYLGCIQGSTLDFCTFTPDQNFLPWMILSPIDIITP